MLSFSIASLFFIVSKGIIDSYFCWVYKSLDEFVEKFKIWEFKASKSLMINGMFSLSDI